jgi:hypothetical protein
MTTAPPTAGQVLDEREFLASAQHALIVEYLTVGYALLVDLPDAAASAANLAQSQMFRLNDVCRALVAAGRNPTLDRAVSIPAGAADISFSPAGPDGYAGYHALVPSAGPDLAKLVGESGPTHLDALQPLHDAIGDPSPPGLLRTVRFEPGKPGAGPGRVAAVVPSLE